MSLRIISEGYARNLERGLQAGRDIGAANLQDTYMSRMSKLVPGEALSSYPLLLNTIPRDPVSSARPLQSVLLVAAVVMIVVVVLRWSATKSAEGKPQWAAVLLSALSFAIWVLVMGSETDFRGLSVAADVMNISSQLISGLALFAWTAIAPAIYTGDRT
jgi:hypothetical protein